MKHHHTTEIYTLSLHDALPIYSNPIGKHVWFDPKKPIAIVGVVGAVKQYGLEIDGKIATYFPQNQRPDPKMFLDRKSTRLNSSHSQISYAVFCLKKKTKTNQR